MFMPMISASWVIFACFCHLLNFFKNIFRNTIRVSNSLDPDQARHFAGPDLGLNCLLRLNISRRQKSPLAWKSYGPNLFLGFVARLGSIQHAQLQRLS